MNQLHVLTRPVQIHGFSMSIQAEIEYFQFFTSGVALLDNTYTQCRLNVLSTGASQSGPKYGLWKAKFEQ